MKKFKYNGILSLKCQNGSLMKNKQKQQQNKDLHYSMQKLYCEKFSDLINRDTKWDFYA